jgi:hypothetical protein
LDDAKLPSLWISLAPVLLPVLLISTNTVLKVFADAEPTTAFQASDVRSWDELRQEFRAQQKSPSPMPAKQVLAQMPEEQRTLLLSTESLSDEDKSAIVEVWNQKLLRNRKFYDEGAFFGLPLNAAAKTLIKENRERLQIGELQRLNRALFESAFPGSDPENPLITPHVWETPRRRAADISALFGNANFALLISALIAIITLATARHLSLKQVANSVEISLMSGGVIILITAAGGAFGAMLTAAKVGDAINAMFANVGQGAGIVMLLMGFLVAAVFKIAQGSTTVSMITTSGMLAGIASIDVLGFHPVYLATAIGSGALVGSWMNDSGFWVFAKMGGLTEGEALKSWTIALTLMAFAGLLVTLALATVLPLRGAVGV